MKKNKRNCSDLYRVEKLIMIGIVVGVILIVILTGYFFSSQYGKGVKSEETVTAEFQPTDSDEKLTEETETVEGSEEERENEDGYVEGTKETRKVMKVQFIDVGQGDATLIQCGGKAIMIDTGSSEAENDILQYLEEQKVENLDYLILSHGHEDHMGRGCDILEKVEVGHVICDFGNQEGYVQRLNNYIKDMEIDLIKPRAGQNFQVGAFEFTILMGRNSDLAFEEELEVTNVNNQSLAVKVKHGENSFLFYGDGEKEYEQLMVEQGLDIGSTVLKVPHHGAAASSTDIALDNIKPRYAVISSAPQEAFGYPSNEVLLRFAIRQITTFYTNKRGSITAVSDGTSISWTAEK